MLLCSMFFACIVLCRFAFHCVALCCLGVGVDVCFVLLLFLLWFALWCVCYVVLCCDYLYLYCGVVSCVSICIGFGFVLWLRCAALLFALVRYYCVLVCGCCYVVLF